MQTSSSAAAFRPRARPAHRTRKDPEMPEIDVMITLTDDELDAVAGGQTTPTASVSWTASGTGSGPTSITITNTATGTTSVIGGNAPSASASLSGTFTVDAS